MSLVEIDDGGIERIRRIDVADQPAFNVLIGLSLAEGAAFERNRLVFTNFDASPARR